MGRHSTGVRGRWRLDSPVTLLSLLLVLALVAWLSFDFIRDRLAGDGCDSPHQLTVAAAPEIAPALNEVAENLPAREGPGCYQVTVVAKDSTETAESLAAGGPGSPGAWVPESSMWLQRARDNGAWNIPDAGQSVASSPVVLALTEDAAGTLGWPAEKPDWQAVLGADPATLPVGLPDPGRDPVGVAGLFGLRATTAGAPDPAAAFTAATRELSRNTEPDSAALFDRLPGGSGAAKPVAAFASSEAAMLRHNARPGGGNQLVAAYPGPEVPALDFPYLVLPGASEATRSAAERFLAALLDPAAHPALGEAGFRAPDGSPLVDRAADRHARQEPWPPPLPPPAAEVDAVLQSWAGVNLSARIQVLLDVSGSMSATAGGDKSRMQLTVEAAIQGIGLFKPTTELGLWLFSTNLDGDKDYRELLPMRTVAEQLAAGAPAQLQAVRPKPNGATGLYDSVLAAYKNARENWQPGRINLVIALTDGRNEDDRTISQEQLLRELGELQDPRRPLPVIGIGIGPDIDQSELSAISAATGGEAFTTPDPAKIADVFYAALSKIMCQPPDCKP